MNVDNFRIAATAANVSLQNNMAEEKVPSGTAEFAAAIVSCATALQTLKRSQKEMASLVRHGMGRPSWKPECPLLRCDVSLEQRLKAASDRIEAAHKILREKRAALLRDAQSASPFECPPVLQERIGRLELLYSHALNKNLQAFAAVFTRRPIAADWGQELRERVERLANVARCGLENSARRHADKLAFRGRKIWDDCYEQYINSCAGDWQSLSKSVRKPLVESRSERHSLKESHDGHLAIAIEPRLTAQLDELRDAVGQAGGIHIEVDAAKRRESEAARAVRCVWQEAHALDPYVRRKGLPLGDIDRMIAKSWARDFDKGNLTYHMAAMESARCAELVALDLYRGIYGTAEDLSILQIKMPSDKRWRAADIDAGRRSIDVKNARESFSPENSAESLPPKSSYIEHCVKRFKSDETNRQVAVSGFLSPYFKNGGSGNGEPIVWLGETTLGSIEALKLKFESDYLHVDFSHGLTSRIPPWLFDYPSACYARRDAALERVRSNDFVLPRRDWFIGACASNTTAVNR
jgi:hypothetical protein